MVLLNNRALPLLLCLIQQFTTYEHSEILFTYQQYLGYIFICEKFQNILSKKLFSQILNGREKGSQWNLHAIKCTNSSKDKIRPKNHQPEWRIPKLHLPESHPPKRFPEISCFFCSFLWWNLRATGVLSNRPVARTVWLAPTIIVLAKLERTA